MSPGSSPAFRRVGLGYRITHWIVCAIFQRVLAHSVRYSCLLLGALIDRRLLASVVGIIDLVVHMRLGRRQSTVH